MLRFTIRDVLWLTLMVGLAIGWWLDRGHVAKERDQLEIRADALEFKAGLLRFAVDGMREAYESGKRDASESGEGADTE